MPRHDIWDSKVKPKIDLIKAWTRDGAIDTDVAKQLGIGKSTLYKYLKIYPELKEAMREGKEEFNVKVENILIKRLMGYEVEETEQVVEDTPHGKHTKIRKVKKHIPPDPTLLIFFMRNRMPEKYGNNKRSYTGSLNINNYGNANNYIDLRQLNLLGDDPDTQSDIPQISRGGDEGEGQA